MGDGVNGFTLDPQIGEFVMTHPNIQVPKRGKVRRAHRHRGMQTEMRRVISRASGTSGSKRAPPRAPPPLLPLLRYNDPLRSKLTTPGLGFCRMQQQTGAAVENVLLIACPRPVFVARCFVRSS